MATSFRIEDIVRGDFTSEIIILTSANEPYHVEWVSHGFSDVFGWSLDEVAGLDSKFLQGRLTNASPMEYAMHRLLSGARNTDTTTVVNYSKDGSALTSKISRYPVIDHALGHSHTALLLTDVEEASTERGFHGCSRRSIGLTLDRRDPCSSFPFRGLRPAPPLNKWLSQCKFISLGVMLRYSLQSQAAIVITDKEERIVHVNSSWVSLTGLSAMQCQGVKIWSILKAEETSENELEYLHHILKSLRSTGSSKKLNIDNNCKDNASVVSVTLSADAPRNKLQNKLMPWGQCWKMRSSDQITPTTVKVCPAMIGTKHIAFLVLHDKELDITSQNEANDVLEGELIDSNCSWQQWAAVSDKLGITDPIESITTALKDTDLEKLPEVTSKPTRRPSYTTMCTTSYNSGCSSSSNNKTKNVNVNTDRTAESSRSTSRKEVQRLQIPPLPSSHPQSPSHPPQSQIQTQTQTNAQTQPHSQDEGDTQRLDGQSSDHETKASKSSAILEPSTAAVLHPASPRCPRPSIPVVSQALRRVRADYRLVDNLQGVEQGFTSSPIASPISSPFGSPRMGVSASPSGNLSSRKSPRGVANASHSTKGNLSGRFFQALSQITKEYGYTMRADTSNKGAGADSALPRKHN